MNEIGVYFCSFLTENLIKDFKKLSKQYILHFSSIPEKVSAVLCKGSIEYWPDSRIETDEIKEHALWWVEGEENSSLKYFFEIIISELEGRFTDILYLKEVEERLKKRISDSLVAFFINDLLDKDWLITRYVKYLLKEKELPSLELLIQFSAQKYEKRTVNTSMYFLKDSCKLMDRVLAFENISEDYWKERRLDDNNLKTIRKMMEMSGKENGLLIDKNREENIYYVSGLISSSEVELLSAIKVQFTGHLSWKIVENGNVLFQCDEGKKQIPAIEKGSDDEWKEELKEVMKSLNQTKYRENVENILNVLKEQPHGTSVVFMQEDMLIAEVQRLASFKRTYPITFNMLKNRDKMLGISAIDGAILADVEGICHSVGAILDGEAMVEGDPGRGARYNSLVNYANWVICQYHEKKRKEKEVWCFVAVLSEDGMITIEKPNPNYV